MVGEYKENEHVKLLCHCSQTLISFDSIEVLAAQYFVHLDPAIIINEIVFTNLFSFAMLC